MPLNKAFNSQQVSQGIERMSHVASTCRLETGWHSLTGQKGGREWLPGAKLRHRMEQQNRM